MSRRRPMSSSKKSGQRGKRCKPLIEVFKPEPEGDLASAIASARAGELSPAEASPLFSAIKNPDVVLASVLLGKLVGTRMYSSQWDPPRQMVVAPTDMLPPIF